MLSLRPLMIALAFLTRLPARAPAPADVVEAGRSVLWYPAVGLVIGLLLLAVGLLAPTVPPAVAAALLLAAWCLVTGGLHLDGLADTADGLVGGHGDPARILAIMKDAAAGPMGVAAIAVVLIVKFAALAALLAGEDWMPVVLAPVLGRAAAVALILTTPYVRSGGMGEALAAHLPHGPALLVLAATLAVAAAGDGIVAVAAALAIFWLWRRTLLRAIGGTTGDTAGALVEVTEAAVLVAATP